MAKGNRGGQPPKTTEQRAREGGTPGKGAVSHRSVKKPVVLAQRVTNANRPQAPDNLPAHGRALWDEVIECLIDMNAAQVIDVPVLQMMCIHYALVMAAYEAILEDGAFTFGSTGQIKESPAVRMYERNSDAFLRRATEFGLTTLARTKLGLLDVTTRSIASDLNSRLGRNPRRTNRDIETGKKQIEA